jgi:hypothetical protein
VRERCRGRELQHQSVALWGLRLWGSLKFEELPFYITSYMEQERGELEEFM